MEWMVPVIVGLFSLVGSVVSALVLHNKNGTVLDMKFDHQTEVLDKKIIHLGDTLELKLKSLGEKVDDVKTEVECVDKKVDRNIAETGKIRIKVVELEKDVETLKKKAETSFVNH